MRWTPATLYNFSKAYREEGIQGLQIGHPPGRHRLLTAEQELQVYEVITNQTPEDQGFPAQMNWTSPLVRKWIEHKWDVRYSDRVT
uniref:helix-turn-helix domain-containing protein n=1 Tax=Paenibacillus sp. FSL H8-0332 TaxID=2954742 RepID=UPI00403F59F8